MVVGVDGSEDADRAVDWAMGEASVHRDKVLLVHAWQFPAIGVTAYAGEALPVFGRDDLEQLAEEVLAKAAARAMSLDPGIDVDTRLIQGHPGESLAEASREARLLVV